MANEAELKEIDRAQIVRMGKGGSRYVLLSKHMRQRFGIDKKTTAIFFQAEDARNDDDIVIRFEGDDPA